MKQSGVLLHITSLPGPYSIGDLGPSAYRFADFLRDSGQQLWQILPLTPTDRVNGHSPYSSPSAFAGNILLISPELMAKDGYLTPEEIVPPGEDDDAAVNYDTAMNFKNRLLEIAYQRFRKEGIEGRPFQRFYQENQEWLKNYAVFSVLKEKFGGESWVAWPEPYKNCSEGILNEVHNSEPEAFDYICFQQFVFFQQWERFKTYCSEQQVHLIGDIPIYVSHDSVDVWAHRDLFVLEDDGHMPVVAGVPPDIFSETGQRWGNPLYNWEVLMGREFSWWMRRLEQQLRMTPVIRIDHFRAFVNYWVVPAHEELAVNGYWENAPTAAFFDTLHARLPGADLIAEDLGMIDDETRAKIEALEIPGMRILMFAFDGDPDHPYLPENYPERCVAYTGTHDNNTVLGWLSDEADTGNKEHLYAYLGREMPDKEALREILVQLYSSRAERVIVPIQDLLELGSEARMNKPGEIQGNWVWRCPRGSFSEDLKVRMLELVESSGRAFDDGDDARKSRAKTL